MPISFRLKVKRSIKLEGTQIQTKEHYAGASYDFASLHSYA